MAFPKWKQWCGLVTEEFIVCEQALKRLKKQQNKKEALICRWQHVPDATAEPDGCYSPTCHLSPELPQREGTSLSEQTPTLWGSFELSLGTKQTETVNLEWKAAVSNQWGNQITALEESGEVTITHKKSVLNQVWKVNQLVELGEEPEKKFL